MLLAAALALATCSEDAARLDALLERWAEDAAAGRYAVGDVPELVVRPLADAATGPRDGATVIVRADTITVDGTRTEPDWVVVALQQNPNVSFGLQRGDERYLNVTVAVAADAPWSAVVAVADAIRRAHLTRMLVVFATPREVGAGLAPRASSLHADLERLDAQAPSERVTTAVGMLHGFSGTCPDLEPVFQGMGGVFPETRARYIADRIAPAVEACKCGAEPDAVAEAFWYLDTRSRVYAVPVTLKAGTLVALPPETRWRDAWAPVVAARAGAQLGFPTP